MIIATVIASFGAACLALLVHAALDAFGNPVSLTLPAMWTFGITALAGASCWFVASYVGEHKSLFLKLGGIGLGVATVAAATAFAAGGNTYVADPQAYRTWSLALALFGALGAAVRQAPPLEKGSRFLPVLGGMFCALFLPAAGTFIALAVLSGGWQALAAAVSGYLTYALIKTAVPDHRRPSP